MNEAMHAAHAARAFPPVSRALFLGPDDEEARRTRLRRRGAWLHRPGRETVSGRDEEGRLAGVTIFDLLGHVKLQGHGREAAAWSGVVVAGIRQSQGPADPAAGRLFLCKLTGDEKAAFLAAQQALGRTLADAGVRSRSVAATSGAARPSLGPKVRNR